METDDKYSSIPDTQAHITRVNEFIAKIVSELQTRGAWHDDSKMKSPELDIFNEYTPKLRGMTYGSDEYKDCLDSMRPALEHHYKENRHHPEHFENDVADMNLIDVVEMFCDWLAATKRHADGDIFKSIELNARRFGYDKLFKDVLINTARHFEEDQTNK
jgi:hypothetical protein